ncbi:protein DOP1A-like isoform X3 [Apostichopus japonicus]|uniref:protein DOP1A-like isoform X3 n=1 Tax=Stichopus japonicus TaxID=307972 RepID=UPI003AB5DA4C
MVFRKKLSPSTLTNRRNSFSKEVVVKYDLTQTDVEFPKMNLDEAELQTDPKYRNYTANVDKALRGFEYSSEWADLISALGKLIKVLQANSKYSCIPKRLVIGKRLAQCTHPALPSGVHLKALETYALIFRTIGPKQLCHDMFIYSAGIFPLLSYAAMPVKPKLLGLYEEHYLPLGEHLRPALTGLLQGILPGLEEGSEHSERTNNLLVQLCAGMVKSNFYSALWESVLTSPTVRLPAINFVLSQIDNKTPMSEQKYLFGSDTQLLVKSVCAALFDTVVLVQRSTLDLVLVCFPLCSASITLSHDQLTELVTATLNTLLRRDMSLNRRLFTWLLGDHDAGGYKAAAPKLTPHDLKKHKRSDSAVSTSSYVSIEDQTVYFETHSRNLLIEGLKTWLHDTPEDTSPGTTDQKVHLLKPYRLLNSLLDKPEVGQAILDDILIEVFRALYQKCTLEPCKGSTSDTFCGVVRRRLKSGSSKPADLIKIANQLFNSLEQYFIWEYVGKKFEMCCRKSGVRMMEPIDRNALTCSELCVLVDFLLDIVSLESYVETPTEYLPQLLCKITMSLTNNCSHLALVEIHDSLQLCLKLMTKVQPSMVLSPHPLDVAPVMVTEQEDELPKELLRHLEGIENDYDMVESQTVPHRDDSVDKDKDEDSSAQERKVSIQSSTTEETSQISESSSESTETFNSTNDEEDETGHQSLDRLASNPSVTSSSSKRQLLSRPTSLAEPTDSPSLQSIVDTDEPFSPRESKLSEKLSHSRSLSSASLTLPESETPPLFLMQACVQCYQNFFSKFVNKKILPGSDTTKSCMKKIQVPRSLFGGTGSEEEKQKHSKISSYLDCLEGVEERSGFESCMIRTNSDLTSDSASATYLRDVSIECNTSNVAIRTFSTACNLLVEFACFPMYCNESISAALLRPPKNKGNLLAIPEWLQVLLTVSCFVKNFTFQTTAANTILELIAMTKSVVSSSKNNQLVLPNPPNSPKSTSGKISVVLIPAISSMHLESLNNGSTFFQRVAVYLWDCLGQATPQYHTKSADLLHQLHNLTPDVFICENVIGNSLIYQEKGASLSAHIKFSLLWHLIRPQILMSSPASRVRTFDRSLLVMLDSLDHADSMARCVTQTWLMHAIDRGDIARLLEPILLVLLHPTTARVSVQYLGRRLLEKRKREKELEESEKELSESEKKIYSISSVNGEVTYYSLKQGQKLRTGVIPKQDPIFALTSVNDKKKVVTKSNLGLNYSQPAKALSKPLNVTINPFSHGYQSDSDSEHGLPALPASAPGTLQRQRSLSSSPKERSVASQKQRRTQRKSSMTPALDSGSSKTVSTEDLSGSDVTDELSYVFNEEVEETVEEIVEGILNDIVNHIAMEIDGSLEMGVETNQDKAKVPDKTTSPHRIQSPGSRSLYGSSRHHGKAQEEFLLEELEGVVPGLRDRLVLAQERKTDEARNEEEETEEDGDEEEQGLIKMLPNINLEMLHPLQQHILLYVQVYDTQRILYVLSRLRFILHTCSRDFVCAMSSTSVSSTNTPQLIKLQQLLARHKRCMTGKDFYVELDAEAPASFRSQTYLEILLQTCVYYVRSFYPIEGKAESSEAVSNRDVQISSMEVLELILKELVGVVRESGRGSATFISDLLMRCKVQKAVLYCLLATVCNARKETSKSGKLLLEISLDAPVELSNRGAQAFQLQLLKLAQTIIILEDQLFSLREESSNNKNEPGEWEFLQLKFHSQNKPLGFSPKDRFSCQGLLLTALLSSLKQYHNCHMHRHWINLITSSLSYLDQGLPHLANPLISQVCRNLEMLSSLYNEEDSKRGPDQSMDNIPPDHVVSMLKGLTAVCHFCLLESTSNVSAMSGRHAGGGVGETESSAASLSISTFFGVLTRDKTKSLVAPTSNQTNTPKSDARRGILKMFPRIVSSISKMWGAVQLCEKQRDSEIRPKDPPRWSIGSPKAVRQQILELLSPIALQHSTSLLAAIGVVWNDNRHKDKDNKRQVIIKPSDEQMVLVELVGAIRALPTDTLVQTIKQVLKAPPFTIRDKNQPGLEVSMLQFLFAYIQKTTSSSLRDAWPSLLLLLKDALSLDLSPPGRFLLFGILHEIVHKVYPFGERKDQRDLQEMCQKLVDACNVIAGSSLEQTTWLRRNMTVKFSPQENVDEGEDPVQSNLSEVTNVDPEQTSPQSPSDVDSKVYSQYSVQALTLLAKYLAPFLDMIYLSDEKEKVVPLLTSIMHNVTPYLRNHSTPNVPSSRACTSLLSSLSGYQYTRKAWKKDAFELFLDPAFFQIDASCVRGWKVIIDNLMTHDRTTFKDLMARVAAFQNTSLNLFASKEQEMEQRAQFLKRLDFAIFCSEMDQYTRSLPDIQERLAESLRLAQVPVVHEQVFLCFRVLLLRFSPHHLTGLWPTMISELVQVFLHLEEQLSSASNQSQDATKKSALRRVATADIASFFTSSSSGPNGGDLLRHKSWLGLYLSACKLLDLALCLPSEDLPQFQVYKWAFVGENPQSASETQFIPHVARVAKLLRAKKNNGPLQPSMDRSHIGRPYLSMTQIKSIDELLPFFNSLCSQDHSYRTTSAAAAVDSNVKTEKSLLESSLRSEEGGLALTDKDYIERLIERDFIVPLS